MYEYAANQIIALLDDGRDAEARALFMEHLAGHCREIDQAVSDFFGRERYDDAQLWEVFALAYREGWFNLMVHYAEV
jgi:hypothetical protein